MVYNFKLLSFFGSFCLKFLKFSLTHLIDLFFCDMATAMHSFIFVGFLGELCKNVSVIFRFIAFLLIRALLLLS